MLKKTLPILAFAILLCGSAFGVQHNHKDKHKPVHSTHVVVVHRHMTSHKRHRRYRKHATVVVKPRHPVPMKNHQK